MSESNSPTSQRRGGLVRRVVANAIWGQAGQTAAFGLQIAVQIVLARGLGLSEYGLFATVNASVFLLVGLISGGTGATLHSQLSRFDYQHGRLAAAHLFWKQWVLRFIWFGAVGFILALFSEPIAGLYLDRPGDADLVVAASLYLVMIGIYGVHLDLFYGLLATKWAALSAIGNQLANLAVASVVLATGASLTTLFLSMAAAQGLVVVAQLCVAWRLVRPGRALLDIGSKPKREIRGMWRFSITVFGSVVLAAVLGQHIDIFMMQLFGVSSDNIGLYNVAMTLALAAREILIFGIAAVAQPALSTIVASDRSKLAASWRAICSTGLVTSLPVLVYVFVFADAIIEVLYGQAFTDAALFLRILTLALIGGMLVGGGTHQVTFRALNLPGKELRARASTGLVNVVGNLTLIPFIGALGAVLATGFAQVLTSLVEYLMIKPIVRATLPWKSYGGIVLAALPGLLPVWFLVNSLGPLGVFVGAAVYFVLFVATLRLLRPMSVEAAIAQGLPRHARGFLRVSPDSAPEDDDNSDPLPPSYGAERHS